MRNKIILFMLCIIIALPFKVYATDYKYLEEGKYTGFIYNNNLKQYMYYKDGKAVMNDWVNANGKTSYYKSDGGEAIGWMQINNNWYCFDSMGIMLTGWWYDRTTSNWYYLNSDGSMAHDTTIDGYKINSSGIWVK